MATGLERFNAASTITKVALYLLGIGMLFHTIGFFTPYYKSYSYVRYNPVTKAMYKEEGNEGLWSTCFLRIVERGSYIRGCSVPLFRACECSLINVPR